MLEPSQKEDLKPVRSDFHMKSYTTLYNSGPAPANPRLCVYLMNIPGPQWNNY